MINEFVSDICSFLGIDKPCISFDTSLFNSRTMLGLYYRGTIYIRPSKEPSPDLFFAIAHELRHAYQLKTNEAYYFKNYKTSEQISIEDYNMQIAEIDANAFASYIMLEWFGLTPLYNGMSKKAISAIKKHIESFY